MLWTIVTILVALWLLTFIVGIGGSLIYTLLVVAAVTLVIQVIVGRRTIV